MTLEVVAQLAARNSPAVRRCVRQSVRELSHQAHEVLEVVRAPVPLSEIEQAWPTDDSVRRTVFTVDRKT